MQRDSLRGSSRPSDDQSGVFETISKPHFKSVPQDLQVREGNPVRLECQVNGRPVPELNWYKNGIQVHNDDNHKIVVNENGIHSLLIMSATRQDKGTYTCIAKN